jgi:Cu/Ag efflux pump CusA
VSSGLTALVASLGILPIARGHGASAAGQKLPTRVVMGGLASATLLTLSCCRACTRASVIAGKLNSDAAARR